MRQIIVGTVILAVLVGCGSKEEVPVAGGTVPAGKVEQGGAPVAAVGGVKLGILPESPVSGSCVTVVVSGKLTERKLSWFLDTDLVQDGGKSEFCIPEGSRDRVLKVVLGDPQTGANAAVTVVNSPPEVLDTQLKLIVDGKRRFLENTPVVKDTDKDEVVLNYKWYINGEPDNGETGGRLDIGSIKKGDLIKLEIRPNDGTVDGAPYVTMESPVPGSPPQIDSRPPTNFKATEFVYQVKGSDPDGEPVTYSLESPPPGATIDPRSGLLTWPLTQVPAGDYKLNIVVTDSEEQKINQEFSINVKKIEEGN